MDTRTTENSWALTEKEKQTLRLIVRGHDAKSTARSLGLSVHTINERLRDARRKMSVSSSREAARLLLQAEGGDVVSSNPDLLGDIEIGEDVHGLEEEQGAASIGGAGRAYPRLWIIIGVFLMTLALGLLALTALSPVASPSQQAGSVAQDAAQSEVVDIARQWLALVDEGRWDESYRGFGTAFQKLNSVQVWAEASQQARVPLGAMITREFVSQQNLPAPPAGYEVVKFRTRFANKTDAIETVSLDREGGQWRVVGVTID
tara:strand:+ start:779 stop:1561 length:783 start_codon:yes stop_codon:yes gene_type:complete